MHIVAAACQQEMLYAYTHIYTICIYTKVQCQNRVPVLSCTQEVLYVCIKLQHVLHCAATLFEVCEAFTLAKRVGSSVS